MTDDNQKLTSDDQQPEISIRDRVERCMEENPNFKWYVLKVTTGHENKVLSVMRERIELEQVQSSVGEVLVPTEEVTEKRAGKARKVNKRFFPGYVLIYMEMTDKMWHFMRMLPGAQGFIGGTRDKPMPVSTREVMNILKRLEPNSAVRQHVDALYEAGESVKVIDGPFADFNGVVEEVMPEKSRLMVSVLIFGRSTPVELDFTQVEKVG